MAKTHDIHIDQNADFRMVLDYRAADNTALDLTGYTFRFYIKDRIGGSTLLDASQYITIDSSQRGRANVAVPKSVTSTLNFDRGVYDILFIHSTKGTLRAAEGQAFLSKGVSP